MPPMEEFWSPKKRSVVTDSVIELLCLRGHNIREAKFIWLAQLPLQAVHPTQGT